MCMTCVGAELEGQASEVSNRAPLEPGMVLTVEPGR